MDKKNMRELSLDEMDMVSGGEDGSKEVTAKDIEELNKEIEKLKNAAEQNTYFGFQPDIQPVKPADK